MVEAVRAGTVFAHDRKAADKWRRAAQRDTSKQRGLVGRDLEAAVMRVAAEFPDNVLNGPA